MATSAAEMKAKVASGVQSVNEAQVSMQMARAKLQDALTIWQSVSDNATLMSAISGVRNADSEVETALSQSMAAVDQANAYAAPL